MAVGDETHWKRLEEKKNGFTCGRKNYLGSRSDRGMKAAGILYTVLATCVQNHIDPAKYIRLTLEARARSEEIPLPHEIELA